MADEAPPLRVLLYPILTVSIIAALFFFYCYSPYGPYDQVVALSNKNLEKALVETTGDTSALSIVVVGSSITEHAFADARKIEDSILRRTHIKTKILRVSLNSMGPDLAKRIDFYEYINKYPPNYLFVENFCFNFDHVDSTGGIAPPIDAALLQIRNYVRNALSIGPQDNYYIKWYTFDTKPSIEFYTHEFDSIAFKGGLRTKCVVRKVSKNGLANNAFDTLMKRKTKVVFLDMPQSNKLKHNFLDPESTSELNEVLKFYKKRYGIDYWALPRVMDDSTFIDGLHLNSTGAMQYQEWFVSEFSAKK
ncbi:MAG TPA: hypothetical protein VIU13_09475 [Chryseolinea sp.]